jgi:predicted dinucleotide-binding enzyme
MRVGVLGTGGVGQTLAAKISSLGHEVMVGTRDVQAALARAEAGYGAMVTPTPLVSRSSEPSPRRGWSRH